MPLRTGSAPRATQPTSRGVYQSAREPDVGLRVELLGDVGRQAHKQVALVGEVEVEGRARDPGRLGDALDVELGERGSLAQQVLVLVRQRMLERSSQQGRQEIAGREPTPSYPAQLNPGIPVSIVKTELARDAAGDHRDCAVHFRLAEKPIDLEVAGRKYDPVYVNLTKAVLSEQGDVPLGAEFVEAHSCVFEGRRFAHIILRYHGQLVSFLVTEMGDSKEAKTNAAPLTNQQAQVIACSQLDGYQVSCFQTARHAVFIVSDLPEGDNLALARALAPSVFAHITRVESAA